MSSYDKITFWFKTNKKPLIIIISLNIIGFLIYYFSWWEVIGILFLKFGLGIKISGAKTLAKAIANAGGTKMIAISTATMLTKRHIIDISSKFFAEHSVSKYKKNLLHVLKIKWGDFKNSTPMKKLQAFFVIVLSIPGVYFFYTKVISVAIQKFVYALIIPLFNFIWIFIRGSFNIVAFIFEIIALNVFLDAISNYKWGRYILEKIDYLISLVVKLFNIFNNLLNISLSIFGIKFNLKSFLILKSIKFNKYLENIIDKGISKILKIERKRDRYINIIEDISIKRHIYSQMKKDKKVSFFKSFKKSFKTKFLKQKDWKEVRKNRKQKQKDRLVKTINYRRKQSILKQKQKRKDLLTLPYHILVKYGDVSARAR